MRTQEGNASLKFLFSCTTCSSRLKQGLFALFLLIWMLPPFSATARISGPCVNCHTMHNSQNGASLTVDLRNNPTLVRRDCIGCHAQGAGEKIVTVGGVQIPQVYHNDASGDLAAGNFAYISGVKDSPGGADPGKGHNVIDLVSPDPFLDAPPGWRHDETVVAGGMRLTCAGSMGCHGIRGQPLTVEDEFGGGKTSYRTGLTAFSGYEGSIILGKKFNGGHHNNYDGVKLGLSHPNFQQDPLAHSYRFIRGLKGYGNQQSRWQNLSSTSHNEYYVFPGVTMDFETVACGGCHVLGINTFEGKITTPYMSMTGFCVTCHGSFHNSTQGVAFVRHPSSLVIKNAGEYANYTTYNVQAPVGRQVLPSNPSSTVTPGTDVVMCLSCHMAHASPYPDMLRWDYSKMMTGTADNTAAGTGCFICHSSKDD